MLSVKGSKNFKNIGVTIMSYKKLLFSFVLGIAMVQSIAAEDPIFRMIRSGHVSELQEYLEIHPEAINEKNDYQESAINVALLIYNPEIIQILLMAGANPNEMQSKYIPRDTFLHFLANSYIGINYQESRDNENNEYSIIKDKMVKEAALLILYGANPSIRDLNG